MWLRPQLFSIKYHMGRDMAFAGCSYLLAHVCIVHIHTSSPYNEHTRTIGSARINLLQWPMRALARLALTIDANAGTAMVDTSPKLTNSYCKKYPPYRIYIVLPI